MVAATISERKKSAAEAVRVAEIEAAEFTQPQREAEARARARAREAEARATEAAREAKHQRILAERLKETKSE